MILHPRYIVSDPTQICSRKDPNPKHLASVPSSVFHRVDHGQQVCVGSEIAGPWNFTAVLMLISILISPKIRDKY
jgi:hypothetical protein